MDIDNGPPANNRKRRLAGQGDKAYVQFKGSKGGEEYNYKLPSDRIANANVERYRTRQIEYLNVVTQTAPDPDTRPHWYIELIAMHDAGFMAANPNKIEEKIIKIDLMQQGYRIIWAAATQGVEPRKRHRLPSPISTSDVIDTVKGIGMRKGPWIFDGFMCDSFVQEVLSELGATPV